MATTELPEASSVFHQGELDAQSKVGVPEHGARLRARAIRPFMPDQHRVFYNQLPFIITGALDLTGQPWASAAFGAPGFMTSPDPQSLMIGTPPLLTSELDLQVGVGNKIGLVGIELQTRRRNRVNAVVTAVNEHGSVMKVDQSFGNCPQYIQTRKLFRRGDPINPLEQGPSLATKTTEKVAKRIISSADVFFVASRTAEISDDPRTGVDASHRGGKPGFVRVGEDGRLSFPDFSGNLFFNTIGNILSDPRVGLFFPDFVSGDAVFLAGMAEIEWDGPSVDAFEGAERLIHITPTRTVLGKSVLPVCGELVDVWPMLEQTGSWE